MKMIWKARRTRRRSGKASAVFSGATCSPRATRRTGGTPTSVSQSIPRDASASTTASSCRAPSARAPSDPGKSLPSPSPLHSSFFFFLFNSFGTLSVQGDGDGGVRVPFQDGRVALRVGLDLSAEMYTSHAHVQSWQIVCSLHVQRVALRVMCALCVLGSQAYQGGAIASRPHQARKPTHAQGPVEVPSVLACLSTLCGLIYRSPHTG